MSGKAPNSWTGRQLLGLSLACFSDHVGSKLLNIDLQEILEIEEILHTRFLGTALSRSLSFLLTLTQKVDEF